MQGLPRTNGALVLGDRLQGPWAPAAAGAGPALSVATSGLGLAGIEPRHQKPSRRVGVPRHKSPAHVGPHEAAPGGDKTLASASKPTDESLSAPAAGVGCGQYGSTKHCDALAHAVGKLARGSIHLVTLLLCASSNWQLGQAISCFSIAGPCVSFSELCPHGSFEPLEHYGSRVHGEPVRTFSN